MSTTILYASRVGVEEVALNDVPSIASDGDSYTRSSKEGPGTSKLHYSPTTPLLMKRSMFDCPEDYDISSPSESPVTVAVEPFQWKSTISFGDTGAEVTLEEEQENGLDSNGFNQFCRKMDAAATPAKVSRMDESLLDNMSACTPGSPETPLKTPFCGLYGCLPQSVASRCRNDMHCDDQSLRLQGCILTSLGSQAEGESWHHLAPPLTYDTVIEEDEHLHGFSKGCPSPHQLRVMHNRAMHSKLKSDRLKKLRRDLHPFGQTHQNRALNRVNSLSTPILPKQKKGKAIESNLTSAWHWSCHSDYAVHPSSPRTLVEVDQKDCYDSDPEDYQETRVRRNVSFHSEDDTNFSGARNDDDVALLSLVQHIFKKRWTLIHHQEGGKPLGVEAWLERGQRLHRVTLPPKIVWLPLEEKSNKVSMNQGAEFTGIDLLDIQRILEVSRVDREAFPFANPRRSFIIKTLHGRSCLEARSVTDRDRIVRQLKMTVARFGSQLVSGDPRVEDFFVPLSHARPVEPNII